MIGISRKLAAVLLAAGAAPVAAQPAAVAAPGATAAPAPQAMPDMPLTTAEARQAASDLATILETNFVFPDVAHHYADALRTKAAAGGYDGFTSAFEFARQVTADLRAVAPDNHLKLMVAPPGGGAPGMGPAAVTAHPAAGTPPGAAGPGPAGAPRLVRMAAGPASEQARWLAPGIAFVRFNLFPGDADTVAAAARFMADHAEAKTIIFDIRTHRGGGLAEMNAIFPFLFAKPTVLVAMDTRASVDRAQGDGDEPQVRRVPAAGDIVHREHYVTPSTTEKRLFGAKVFVLTSARTGSAAEHFALALKRTHRATLIGETTGGAGNYGGFQPVGAKFLAFVPVGHSFDPDTGKGWEGVGVAPDVAVPAERALVEALTRSGVAPADAERLSAEAAPAGPMTRLVPRHD